MSEWFGRDITGCAVSTEVTMSNGEQGPLPNLPQDGKAHRQKYWGMGLAVLGFLLEWMVTNIDRERLEGGDCVSG